MDKDMLRVGVMTATHGLNGDVKVFPTTDDPGRFDHLKEVWVDCGQETLLWHIDHVRHFKQFVILHFKEIPAIEDAQKFVKKDLYVTRDNAVALEENEYFISDLIGLAVSDENGRDLGRLEDVLETGANDVYIVKSGEKEILIPAIRQCILAVDLAGGKMTVHLLEGME